MTQWNIVWKSYMEDCKRTRIMSDIYSSVSWMHKIVLIVSAFFFVMLVVAVVSTQLFDLPGNKNLWLAGVVFFEIIFLLAGHKAKNIYKEKFYSKHDLSQIPPENYRHQEIRYLKFRHKLIKENIVPENIKILLEILSSREEMENVSGLYAKRFSGFTIAVIIALIVSLLRSASPASLAIISFFGIILGFFIYSIASLIPSPVEKIRELNYFLNLYKNEDTALLKL